jgi:hypothetical protein
VNRKRKLDQQSAHHDMQLYDFITRRRAKAPSLPVSNTRFVKKVSTYFSDTKSFVLVVNVIHKSFNVYLNAKRAYVACVHACAAPRVPFCSQKSHFKLHSFIVKCEHFCWATTIQAEYFLT